jgi:cyclophilin family peptidyl-prolyl cis-trans isomerase/HEAT repeat protein
MVSFPSLLCLLNLLCTFTAKNKKSQLRMNRTIALPLLLIWALSWQWGCLPPTERVLTEIHLEVEDPLFQQIRDFQDRQLADSLYPFFKHDDPTYRLLAALAFASLRQPEAIDSLAVLLGDPVARVREAAAFALGQSGAPEATPLLIGGFAREDTAGRYQVANRAILEAVGRCGSPAELELLANISTYQARDTALLEGQALGIYRFALRNIILPAGTNRMLEMVAETAYPPSVRLIAAHYLQRAEGLKLDSLAGQALAQALTRENSPDIRMALALALGKAPSEAALEALLARYKQEEDYRVQYNILRALSNYTYDKVQETMNQALKSPNAHLARRAAEFFLEKGISEDATFYWRAAKDSLPWNVQLTLYQAANRHLPAYRTEIRDAINTELRQRLLSASSPYEKAATLKALSEFGWNFRYIHQEGSRSESPVVRSAAMEALAAISNRPDFRAFFGEGYRQVRRELLNFYLLAMRSGDPGMIAIAAESLRNKNLNYQAYIDTVAIRLLDTALARLTLPKEIETYNELNKTIALLRGQPEPVNMTPDFNHPINWDVLTRLPKNRTALIKTNQGDIELQLLTEDAPGTVANFVALARQGFFNDKVFHRVVPNFVIQGGCPRGDGYGSLDYSIRSELSLLRYDAEGYVGMASAGNHTECTQFFITHSPTPHLDGNYTIFAKVVKGMEAVHQIQVGNRIVEVVAP